MNTLLRASRELVENPERPAPPIEQVVCRARTLRRRQRARRVCVGVVTVGSLGALLFGLTIGGTDQDQIVVTGPHNAPSGETRPWTSIPMSEVTESRIVRVGSVTYVVGTSPTNAAAIWEIDASEPARLQLRFRSANHNFETNRPNPLVSDIAQGNGVLVASGQDAVRGRDRIGAAVWRSADGGATWQDADVQQPAEFSRPIPNGITRPPSTIARVVFANGRFYAFGSSFSADDTTGGTIPRICRPLVWDSTDGSTWTLASVTATSECTGFVDATDGPNGLIGITARGSIQTGAAQVWIERNNEWTPVTTSGVPLGQITSLASSPGGYVAVGTDANQAAIWSSPDGRAWTRRASVPAPKPLGEAQATFVGVTHGSAGWVAVGWTSHIGLGEPFTDAIVWTSASGTDWRSTRENPFAEFAYPTAVGPTARGFIISGSANTRGTGSAQDPIRTDGTVWIGDGLPQ